MVELRFFQNASIEITHIFLLSINQNRSNVKKLICKMQNENGFTNKRFILNPKRNFLTIKGLNL